jgi:V/A-type H+-transporting ATPase subunit K
MNLGLLLALSGVAISVFVSGIGSAKGVAIVGKAGAGVVAEDPEKFSQVLLLQALPATQGIYGFLIGFVILIRLDIFRELAEISTSGGMMMLIGSLPIAIVGLISAILQAKVSAAGIGIIAKKPEELGKAITFSVIVETYAVLALLASFLIVFFVPLT